MTTEQLIDSIRRAASNPHAPSKIELCPEKHPDDGFVLRVWKEGKKNAATEIEIYSQNHFLKYLQEGDPSLIVTSPLEALEDLDDAEIRKLDEMSDGYLVEICKIGKQQGIHTRCFVIQGSARSDFEFVGTDQDDAIHEILNYGTTRSEILLKEANQNV